ncbi:MAG TPA: MarR family transcriptional regulator [Acidimicrobiales bacterium]
MNDWLLPDEMRAWRGFVEVHTAVLAKLEADLVERHGLTGGDYALLVTLSEAPKGRMRMCDLAGRLHLSPSGLTRRLDVMARDGLVARQPSDEDRRVILAVLTPKGRRVLEKAAPDHVAGVRRAFLAHLNQTQIRALGDAMESVHLGLVGNSVPVR